MLVFVAISPKKTPEKVINSIKKRFERHRFTPQVVTDTKKFSRLTDTDLSLIIDR
jgi:hypothetical protein